MAKMYFKLRTNLSFGFLSPFSTSHGGQKKRRTFSESQGLLNILSSPRLGKRRIPKEKKKSKNLVEDDVKFLIRMEHLVKVSKNV